MLTLAGSPSPTFGSLLFEASLRNGNYGAGAAVNTFPPNHGGSPGVLGIVNSSDGATFTSTETTGRSNALINWQIGAGASNPAFRRTGTVSFWFKADRATHVGGSILGDNYGFNQFHNGQGTFGVGASRKLNGAGADDDQVTVGWSTWHNNVWYDHTASQVPVLEYNRWYNIGFTWGGPQYNFEIWLDGTRVVGRNLPAGATFPWGSDGFPSAFNFGLGDNHERGIDPYNSAAGVTFADIRIWSEHRAQGDTLSPDADGDGVSVAQGDCNDNNPNVYPGAAESCNGADDNCNSATDEGFDVGASCTEGTGACERSGTLVCAADFSGTECNATPGDPSSEICNGSDDDCDGEVDAIGLQPLSQWCYTGPEGTQGVGVCQAGLQTCGDGSFGVCVGEGLPSAEGCDGLDNDCNGLVDDGEVCVTHDLAVTDISAPATVALTNKKPTQTREIKVQIQNRSVHSETIGDMDMLDNLVSLRTYSLDTGLCPDPLVRLADKQKALPITLKSKQKLTVTFEVTFDCAVDATKRTKRDPGHEDYRYEATANHAALDGRPDTHVADDICPRAALGPDPRPDGKIEDKGCDEVMTDVVMK
jgi:hypothetical protein